MIPSEEVFLKLVRLGIDHPACAVSEDIEWSSIQVLAERQGLYAVVLDGIERLTEKSRPPQELLLEWIGEVLQGYEYRYEQYRKAISELAGFYNSHGYKMMVLKGYACSLDWPKPSHRPCGDIDIWQFGDFKKADGLLSSEKGIAVDKSHHHHTVFYWRDFMVENHYDFIDTSIRSSSRKMESVFKELGTDDSHYTDVDGERVYLPTPNLHALFLIRHMVDHFTSVSISLRQLLDWAFFVENHTKEIDWAWLNKILSDNKLSDFTNCLNAICVEDLGFESSIFHGVKFNPQLKDAILTDILDPKYEAAEPKHLISRLLYKYKRWEGNAWKQKLCYPESRFLSFFTGLKSHLIKPSI